jgi:hypothetical protein
VQWRYSGNYDGGAVFEGLTRVRTELTGFGLEADLSVSWDTNNAFVTVTSYFNGVPAAEITGVTESTEIELAFTVIVNSGAAGNTEISLSLGQPGGGWRYTETIPVPIPNLDAPVIDPQFPACTVWVEWQPDNAYPGDWSCVYRRFPDGSVRFFTNAFFASPHMVPGERDANGMFTGPWEEIAPPVLHNGVPLVIEGQIVRPWRESRVYGLGGATEIVELNGYLFQSVPWFNRDNIPSVNSGMWSLLGSIPFSSAPLMVSETDNVLEPGSNAAS